MATSTTQPHFLVVTFPGQGHINPSLQFSKRLLRFGARVTFVTATHAYRRMPDSFTNNGLSFATFSDGHDDGGPTSDTDVDHYMATLERRGSDTLRDFIINARDNQTTFTCVFYTVLMPWVSDVATSLDIPSTLVWIQPATVFCIYYYYFNGYEEMLRNAVKDTSSEPAQLPGLPLSLSGRDIPSFLGPASPYSFSLPLLKRHFEILRAKGDNFTRTVLINTFDALEADAMRAIETLRLKGIGPLIPSSILDNGIGDTGFGGDLFRQSEEVDYIKWLNSKPKGSVIYVSFGSISVLSEKQEEEMAQGLLMCGKPFLWVIRSTKNNKGVNVSISKDVGMVVPWCSQVEVLSHPSIGCFVTHCGWNSTIESLVCGVPVVGFPQWTDQHTNAKLIEDLWGTGVRVTMTNDDEGVIPAQEINRCLELVVGNGEMKEKAQKWRQLAIQASKEGGSSHNNLRTFMDEIIMGSN